MRARGAFLKRLVACLIVLSLLPAIMGFSGTVWAEEPGEWPQEPLEPVFEGEITEETILPAASQEPPSDDLPEPSESLGEYAEDPGQTESDAADAKQEPTDDALETQEVFEEISEPSSEETDSETIPEEEEAFYQDAELDGLCVSVAADPGTFPPDTLLTVQKSRDETIAEAAGAVLGFETGDCLFLRHSIVCIFGPEPNGDAWVSLRDAGYSALREQYSDAASSTFVLRICEPAPDVDTGMYGIEPVESMRDGDVLSFPLTGMGCYVLLTVIQLPGAEGSESAGEPVSETDEEPTAEPAREVPEGATTAEEAESAGEPVSETAEEPVTELIGEVQEETATDEEENDTEEVSEIEIGILACIYAPDGYVMLSVNTIPEEGMEWRFDGKPLFITSNGQYRLLVSEQFAVEEFLTSDGLAQLSAAPETELNQIPLGDVSMDGVVNISDANIVYQLILEGPSYYGEEQLSLYQRILADMNEDLQYTIEDLDLIMNYINGVK